MLFLVDFDGTITVNDIVDTLLNKYAVGDYWTSQQQWLAGEINSQECMKTQVPLIKANKQTLDEFFDNVKIDPFFKEFVELVHPFSELIILSDGLDYPITLLLKRLNLKNIPYYANKMLYAKDGLDISFPYSQSNCIVQSGMCKCAIAMKTMKTSSRPTILIGNGKSDICLTRLVDVIYAKDSLVQYCDENKLPYKKFENFGDIISDLKNSYPQSFK